MSLQQNKLTEGGRKIKEVVGICPQCGGDVLVGKQKFYCLNFPKGKCRFMLHKLYFKRWGEQRPFTKKGMRILLRGEEIYLRNLVTVKSGNKFDCFGILRWFPRKNRWGIGFIDTKWHD